MSRWNQPICERDWIERNSVWEEVPGLPDGQARLVSIRQPVRLNEPEVERCSYCGGPTIFGAYVRDDPATAPYPPELAR